MPSSERGVADLRRALGTEDREALVAALDDLSDPEIAGAVGALSASELADVADVLSLSELAAVVEALPEAGRAELTAAVEEERLADAFALLPPAEQRETLRALAADDARALLSGLPPDDAAAFLSALPEEERSDALGALPAPRAAEVRQLLAYAPESVGRLMSPRFLAVREDWTAEQALRALREQEVPPETAQTAYVVDRDGELLDDVPLRAVLQSDPETRMRELMDEAVVTLEADQDREEAVQVMEDFEEYVLPVVDRDRHVLGVVTMDDVLRVARREETEDFHRLGASEPLEEDYFGNSNLQIARRRVGWLLFLFLAGALSSSVVGLFEEQLAQVVVLVTFVPLLIGTGGNAGAQTVTTVIRALAVGEVEPRQVVPVALREVSVGLLVGVCLGAAAFGVGALIWGTGRGVALVLGLSMPAVCVLATGVAAAVPIGAARAGADPATVSAPLIATFVDVAGLLVYFGIATAVLGL